MPIHEFICPKGHKTEKIILSMAEAMKTNSIPCPVKNCKGIALKEISAGAFLLWGSPDGYYKPSPTAKRKLPENANLDSISYDGKKGDYFK